jgi:predicted amidohydrolase
MNRNFPGIGDNLPMQIRVAGAQICVTNNIQANQKTILRAIDFAAAEHADILLTPEGSLSGYTPHFDQPTLDVALQAVTDYARRAGVGLALGTCYVEPADDLCYDQLRFYAPNGTYLGFHTKILTCGTLADPPEGEINDYAQAPLHTFSFGGITVGGLVCNDMWANPGCTPVPDPHLAQMLSRMGARVIFHSVNGGRDGSELSKVAWWYHESNLRMRALAGKVWIVTVDSAEPVNLPASAPGGVITPGGEWAARSATQGESFFAYTITE